VRLRLLVYGIEIWRSAVHHNRKQAKTDLLIRAVSSLHFCHNAPAHRASCCLIVRLYFLKSRLSALSVV